MFNKKLKEEVETQIEKLQKWIDDRRHAIVDPYNEGWKEEDECQEFNEGDQTELRLLDELETFINKK